MPEHIGSVRTLADGESVQTISCISSPSNPSGLFTEYRIKLELKTNLGVDATVSGLVEGTY